MTELKRFRVVWGKIKWLAETLGKNFATVSKWCTNTHQIMRIEIFTKVAGVLEVNMRELFVSSNQQKQHERMDTHRDY